MNSILRRVKGALAAGCLTAILLASPAALSAKDRDDNKSQATRVPGNRLYYYPYYYYSYYPHYYSRFYDPFYDPFYSPFYNSYRYYDNRIDETTGKIKLKGVDKHDQIFLNGSFAGSGNDLKTMRLKPGDYRVEVKRAGKDILNERIYVTAGKTIKLDTETRTTQE